MSTIVKLWYAVYTKPHCEKKVSDLLVKKGIENYCPFNRVQKQWSDRKKIIHEPLFSSYVFVRIDATEQLKVRQTQGILNFVYWLNKPAVIRNEEIDTIKQFLNEHSFVRLEKVALNVEDLVKIVSGPFMAQQGRVISLKKKTVKIALPSLGYWMHAEVEISNIKLIQDKATLQKELYIH